MNNKLKDFDIVKAQAGSPVQFEDGREVKLIRFDLRSEHRVLGTYFDSEDQEEMSGTWDYKGRYIGQNNPTTLDLFMKPVKNTYWVNVYRGVLQHFTGETLFISEQYARQYYNGYHTDKVYLGTFPIEIEE